MRHHGRRAVLEDFYEQQGTADTTGMNSGGKDPHGVPDNIDGGATKPAEAAADNGGVIAAHQPADGAFLVDTEVEDHDNLEADILLVDEAQNTVIRDDQEQMAVLESCANWIVVLEELVESETGTEQTLDLVQTGVNDQMARIDEDSPFSDVPALEDGSLSIQQRHQLALEGLREWWHRYATAVVVEQKHSNDFWTDLLSSLPERLGKYEERLKKTEKEYNEEKGKWKSTENTGNLVAMWYHFATEKGDAKQFMTEIRKDLAMSRYVLTTYPQAVSGLYKKVVGQLKGVKLGSVAEAAKFIHAIEGNEHPAGLFKKEFLGGKPFLSVTGLELEVGSRKQPVSLGKDTFGKLADLAQPKKVVESGSWRHTLKKVFANPNKKVHSEEMDFTFTPQDVGEVIKIGFEYIKGVQDFMKVANQFETEGKELESILARVGETIGAGIDGATAKQVLAAMRQVQYYLENIQSCFKSPATTEMARALKSAKYCDYMALRMIYQAR